MLKEEKGKVQLEADDINAKLQVITACLEKFEPVLDRATAALKSITPHDINILKVMKNPPKVDTAGHGYGPDSVAALRRSEAVGRRKCEKSDAQERQWGGVCRNGSSGLQSRFQTP